MVFDAVFRTALQLSTNLAPAVAVTAVRFDEGPLLLLGPLARLDGWIQLCDACGGSWNAQLYLIAPSLPALLANAPREVGCNVTPSSLAEIFD